MFKSAFSLFSKIAASLVVGFVTLEIYSVVNFLLNRVDDFSVFLGTLLLALLVVVVPLLTYTIWRSHGSYSEDYRD